MAGMNQINIIAELANSHQGNPKMALKLAQEVVESGANSIKFQIYFADEFLTTTHPRYEHFKKQAFSKDEWIELLTVSKKLGVEVYADIFGLEAFDIAKQCDVDGYKLHSSDLNNTKLLEELALQDKKVFLATGGSTILEMQYALDKLTKHNKCQDIIMLHGFQAYPTKVEDSVLSRLSKLKELFGEVVRIGYSDHIHGDDRFATILPLMSIPYGVDYIEKHVTLDRAAKGVDYYSSYEPEELRAFIKDVRLAEQSIGLNSLGFSDSEKKYRNTVKKSWTTVKDIKVNDIIKEGDILMKRSVDFFAPPIYEEIIGAKVSSDIRKEGCISREVLKNKVLAIIVARSNSSRLPGKATKKINGKPTITHLFERVKIAKEKGFIDSIAFCTTTLLVDDELVNLAKDYPMSIYRGSVEDVLSRMMLAVDDKQDHNIVLRITGDDILIDSEYLHKTVKYHLERNAHYTDAKKLPSGSEVEVFDSYILKLISELSRDSSGSEYLTNYITNNIDQFETASLPIKTKHDKNFRLTLDTIEDFKVINSLLVHMKESGKEFSYNMDDIFEYFSNNPKILDINKPINQKIAPISVNTEINWSDFTKAPLVTVYITNHNYEKFIKQSIDSVLSQKFRNFEVIIIDDGSTDKSREIIEQYRNNPKVDIVYQENKGLNVTNNIAIKLSRGKYIMRLDADDYLNENALMILSQKLLGDDSLALVFPDYYLVDENANIIVEEKRHNFQNVTMYDQPAHGACTMIRKDVLIELEGYSEEFTRQDGYEIWVKVIQNKKVSNVGLPLFYYRQHGNSLTKNKEKLYNTRHQIVKKHTEKLDVKNKNHIVIIPIRDKSTNPICLRQFDSTTLLDITIKNILKTDNINQIIVTTPNEIIENYIKNNYKENIIVDLRPSKLARVNIHIEDTVKYVIEKYKISSDTISVVNYEYPLRNSFYIDKAINTLYLFNAKSVMSVTQENANFYLHQGCGLKSFNTNTDLRLERDFIYKESGGIHCIKFDFFKQNSKIISDRSSHIVLDSKASLQVKSEEDFEYLEYLYKKKDL
jgi:sialic acid synthase SpsE/spore coat polysaccharide biosynthesis protein SpsF (cytidylyltransferase family)/glycosyltransferase involved in cell wall biosynthesis